MLEIRWRYAAPLVLAALLAAAGGTGLTAAGQGPGDEGSTVRAMAQAAMPPDPGVTTIAGGALTVPVQAPATRDVAPRHASAVCDDGEAWRSAALPDGERPAWSRLTAEIDSAGRLTGHTLRAAVSGGPAAFAVPLPAESFAATPVGGVVMYGLDDGRRSRVRMLDVRTGCEHTLLEATDVIRRATFDPVSRDVYYFMVERGSRRDLGVWRRPYGAATGQRVMAPIGGDAAEDGAFGPTYSTELHWSVGRDALAVQSCGADGCRTRILAVRDGSVSRVRGIQGIVVALTPTTLVAFAACHGFPCPLEATRLDTGQRSLIVRDVVAARPGEGTLEVDVLTAGGGRERRSIALDALGSHQRGTSVEVAR